MSSELLDVLAARSGLVCLVGAGGKKTTLYRLAALHPGRVGMTATVHTLPFPEMSEMRQVVAEESELLPAVIATTARRVAFARPSPKPRRLAGINPEQVAAIHAAAGFDVTLIKADGARARWIKAPGDDEPPLPGTTATVIAVVSARAIGEPLTERVAHRVERLAGVTGAQPGEILTPEHVARLLAHPQGALKGVGEAVVVPLINAVDDAEHERLARAAAERALALTERFDRVVLAAMRRPDPLIAVISR